MFVMPFVKLAGNLVSPSIELNEEGVLVSSVAAVITGGLSLWAQRIFDSVGADEDRCEAALIEVGSHLPLEK
jgi:hypothetical protein